MNNTPSNPRFLPRSAASALSKPKSTGAESKYTSGVLGARMGTQMSGVSRPSTNQNKPAYSPVKAGGQKTAIQKSGTVTAKITPVKATSQHQPVTPQKAPMAGSSRPNYGKIETQKRPAAAPKAPGHKPNANSVGGSGMGGIKAGPANGKLQQLMNFNVKPPPSRKSGSRRSATKSVASIDSDFGRGTAQALDSAEVQKQAAFVGDVDTVSSNLDRASREIAGACVQNLVKEHKKIQGDAEETRIKQQQSQEAQTRSKTPLNIQEQESISTVASAKSKLNRRPRSSRKASMSGEGIQNQIAQTLIQKYDQQLESLEEQMKAIRHAPGAAEAGAMANKEAGYGQGSSQEVSNGANTVQPPQILGNSRPRTPPRAQNVAGVTPTTLDCAKRDSERYMKGIFQKYSPPRTGKRSPQQPDAASPKTWEQEESAALEPARKPLSQLQENEVTEDDERLDTKEELQDSARKQSASYIKGLLHEARSRSSSIMRGVAEPSSFGEQDASLQLHQEQSSLPEAAVAAPKPSVQTDLRYEQSGTSSKAIEQTPDESPVECKRIEGFLSEYRNTNASARIEHDDELEEMAIGPSGPSKARKSINDLLNSRVNLSQTKVQNQWLKDVIAPNKMSVQMSKVMSPRSSGEDEVPPASKPDAGTQYSAKNREKLEKIEAALKEKKERLSISGSSIRLSGIQDPHLREAIQSQADEIQYQDAQIGATLAQLGFTKVTDDGMAKRPSQSTNGHTRSVSGLSQKSNDSKTKQGKTNNPYPIKPYVKPGTNGKTTKDVNYYQEKNISHEPARKPAVPRQSNAKYGARQQPATKAKLSASGRVLNEDLSSMQSPKQENMNMATIDAAEYSPQTFRVQNAIRVDTNENVGDEEEKETGRFQTITDKKIKGSQGPIQQSQEMAIDVSEFSEENENQGSPALSSKGEQKLAEDTSQRRLQKHMEGVDTIMESEPNFECSQRLDLGKILDGLEDSAPRVDTETLDVDRSQPLVQKSQFTTIQQQSLPSKNHYVKQGPGHQRNKSSGLQAQPILQTKMKPTRQPVLQNQRSSSALSSSRSVFATRNKPRVVNKTKGAPAQTSRSNRSALSNYSSNVAPVRQGSTLLQDTKSSARKSVSRDNLTKVNLKTAKPTDLPMQMSADPATAAPEPVEKKATPRALYADGEAPRMSMIELQKQYENRIGFYQDFYKSVPSYREFDPDKGYEEFLKRKSIAEEQKREGLQKTEILYQEAMLRKQQTLQQDFEGTVSENGNASSTRRGHQKSNTMYSTVAEEGQKAFQTLDQPRTQALKAGSGQTPAISPQRAFGAPSKKVTQAASTTSLRAGTRGARNASNSSASSSVLNRGASNYFSTQSKVSQAKPLGQSRNTSTPLGGSSIGSSTSTVRMNKTPSTLGRRPTGNSVIKPYTKPTRQAVTPNKTTGKLNNRKLPEQPATTRPDPKALEAERMLREEADLNEKEKAAAEAAKEQERKEANRPKAQYLKAKMIEAFKSVGIKLQDQLWRNSDDEEALNTATVYLSKDQFRNAMINIGYLKDYNRKAPKLHQDLGNDRDEEYRKSLRSHVGVDDIEAKIKQLENYQFEDCFALLASAGEQAGAIDAKSGVSVGGLNKSGQLANNIVNIESVKCFVNAMNGLVEDWMLVGAPHKPKVPKESKKEEKPQPQLPQIERPNVSARLSLMQKRLLGAKGIRELEEEEYRKSIAMQEEQLKTLNKISVQDASSDSDQGENASTILKTGPQAFFQLKNANECQSLQTKFSHLLHNFREKEIVETSQRSERGDRQSQRQSTHRSLDSGRDSIRSINKPPNTAALDEKNQLTFGEADRLETKHFQSVEQPEAQIPLPSPSFAENQFQTFDDSKSQNVKKQLEKQQKNYNMPKPISAMKQPQRQYEKNEKSPISAKSPISSKPLNQVSPKPSPKPSPQQLLHPNQTKIGVSKKAITPNYIAKPTPSFKDRIPPKSKSPLTGMRKAPASTAIKPYGKSNIPSTQVSRGGYGSSKALPAQIHSISGKSGREQSRSPHNPFSEDRNHNPFKEERSRTGSIQSTGDARKKRQTESKKETNAEKTPSLDRKSGLTAKLQENSLEPESLSHKLIENDQNTTQSDFNEKNIDDKQLDMSLEPQSLSRDISKQKMIRDKTSRPNLNEANSSKNSRKNLELQEQRTSNTIRTPTKGEFDKNLMKDINNLLQHNQEEEENSKFNYLDGSIKIVRTEERLPGATSPQTGSSKIQFNHNESELREKFIEEVKSNQEEPNEDRDHKTLNPTPDTFTPIAQDTQLLEQKLSARHFESPDRKSKNTGRSGKSDEPILILDIKLVKDKPEKITVYENDKPEDIVKKFCQEHKLDSGKQERLLGVIKEQIKEYYQEMEEAMLLENSPGQPTTSPRKHGLDSEFQNDREYLATSQPLTQIDENVHETDTSLDSDN